MIRPAVENDLHSILEIYNDAIINTTAVYTYEAQTLEEKKSWLKKKKEDNFPVLVYEEKDRVIGFVTFGPFRAWPAYKYTIEHSVYVHKECRDNGVGTALLKQIITTANERGFATLVAGIDASNKKSIGLHEKLGFKYSGTIKRAGFKFGRWLDLVFYQLDLDGPKKPADG